MKKILICIYMMFIPLQVSAIAANTISLLSEEESSQLRYSDSEWDAVEDDQIFASEQQSDYPIIEFVAPQLIQNSHLIDDSPMDLLVFFKSPIGEINMDSLQVKLHKGLVKFSLNDRLAPFIKNNRIVANGLAVPKGRYVISIGIEDEFGQQTYEKYKLVVK